MVKSPSSIFDGPDETLLDTRQQCQFFGGRSQMWLVRREKGRAECERLHPGSGFPLARYISGRKYRTLGECRRWLNAQPHFRVTPPASKVPKSPKRKKQQEQTSAVEA
jgi:hypothetical protein